MSIIDSDVRNQALNTEESFIVQAPAGSGKTELLTQRYLKLLCTVAQPESIIAVTFTRKAAAEMKHRVLESLELARHDEPEQHHKRQTWQIAKAALDHDQNQNWQLADSHHRLRIITIDALASFICRQTPLLTQVDTDTQISDTAERLYREAVHRLIDHCERDSHSKPALLNCLLHVDNNMALFEGLMMNMLAKRDQWLPHLMPHYASRENLRLLLESSLSDAVEATLDNVYASLSASQRKQLTELCNVAYTNLDSDHPIQQLWHEDGALEATIDALPYWQTAAEILLTQKNEWRAQVTKRQGFPTQQKQAKQQLKALIAELQQSDACLAAWRQLRRCPSPNYNQQQWQILDSLITILPLCVAQLHMVFQMQRQLDFCEINLAADRALGETNNPTDLALYLDYKINHLLIDEFQDTSTSQYRLIEKIIAEWQTGDGRTLFAVGDPMQSIYRFRQAEVGLFIRTQRLGIAQIKPVTLQLQSNFRSNQSLVNWFNQSFSHIFPKQADINSGAIDYHHATATQDDTTLTQANCYQIDDEDTDNAAASCAIVRDLLANGADNIAILIQARSHAQPILEQLAEHNIKTAAVDIHPLIDASEIDELMTLISAMTDPANRIAWLGLLRSPALALPIDACWSLCHHNNDYPLWLSLVQFDDTRCDDELRNALSRFKAVVANLYSLQGRMPLYSWITQAWHDLGFASLYASNEQRSHIEQALAILETQASTQFDIDQYRSQLHKQFSNAHNHSDAAVQVMTVHKSKGLEFDHVIIPHCERRPVRDKPNLLLWQQHETNHGDHALILAPIKSPDELGDSIYRYCQYAEQQKLDYEQARVLYVAATRAKISLHFIAKGDRIPSGSYRQLLQHAFEHRSQPLPAIPESSTLQKSETHCLWRIADLPTLKDTASLPLYPQLDNAPQLDSQALTPSNQLPRLIGTVIHQQLQQLAQQPQRTPSRANIAMQCRQLGMATEQLNEAIAQTELALQAIQSDPRGQWILQAHSDAHCEYSLQYSDGRQQHTAIVDRTFIDQGVRWIIDYKTAKPTPEQSTDDFLESQKSHYFDQLQQYATLFSNLGNHPVQCALYFPMDSLWIEWSFNDQTLTVE